MMSALRRYRLLSYKICPFCNKTKSVLRYFGIPYENTEVNPLTKKEIGFLKDQGIGKVPVLEVEGPDGERKYIGESSVIVNEILDTLQGDAKLSSHERETFASPEAQNWSVWADEELAVLLYPNITRSLSSSFQAFGYVHEVDTFSFVDKYANHMLGSVAMWAAASRIKKKYGIDDEKLALMDAARRWSRELESSKGPYSLGGKEPNLGDLGVFGCFRAIEGLPVQEELFSHPQLASLKPWYSQLFKRLECRPLRRAR